MQDFIKELNSRIQNKCIELNIKDANKYNLQTNDLTQTELDLLAKQKEEFDASNNCCLLEYIFDMLKKKSAKQKKQEGKTVTNRQAENYIVELAKKSKDKSIRAKERKLKTCIDIYSFNIVMLALNSIYKKADKCNVDANEIQSYINILQKDRGVER